MIECGGLHAFGKLTDSPVDEHCKDAVWAISNIAVSDHSPCSKYGTSFKLLALITSGCVCVFHSGRDQRADPEADRCQAHTEARKGVAHPLGERQD